MPSRDPLSETLQTWQHTPAAAPTFEADVWARIASQDHVVAPQSFYRWVLPLAASVALFAGAGSAVLESRRHHTERMATSYVQSIDPLQMHAATSRP